MKAIYLYTFILFLIVSVLGIKCQNISQDETSGLSRGNVIFIHPDGSGVAAWAVLRVLDKGPDGFLNWDLMENMGVYRGHLTNSLSSSSNGAATVHAYGVKVPYHSYGTYEEERLTALSGLDKSIMQEARDAGMAVAIINSGHLCEPGSGAFVASYPNRSKTDTISIQIIESGADIILSGGEKLLLPEGVMGRHGVAGVRKDGRNLILRAQQLGYQVVYTREELFSLSPETDKVLGVFASGHTFNDHSEEYLDEHNLPLYFKTSPTVSQMLEVSLKILEHKNKQFLLVLEEEGSDNFANENNATGTMEALRRADSALGVAINFVKKNPNNMLITAADSDAGGMQIIGVRDPEKFEVPLPTSAKNGSPLDGRAGTSSAPFIAAPDRLGNQLHFGICWASTKDLGGGVVAKAYGLNSHLLPANVDNTDIYRMMYATLFGEWLP
jgi:alkaline phosphatase